MGEQTQMWAMVDPPRGMYPARLDDKGRLKLPVSFQQFFLALREKTYFVTSLDRRTASLYPLSQWIETEKQLVSRPDLNQQAKNVAFTAADLGSLAEMDSQGRILFSPELRRELGIENAPVRIWFNLARKRFDVLSDAVYEEQKKRAVDNVAGDLDALEAVGLI